MSVLGCFDGCVLINLDSRPDRLAQATEECLRAGIEFTRMPGVVCQPEDWPDMPATTVAAERWGHLGCAFSHMAAIRLARREGWYNCLVLEDDVIFRPGFAADVGLVLAELAALEWDMFYLWHRSKWERPMSGRIVRISGTDQTHAYAMHGRAFDAFLGGFRPEGLPMAIDKWYNVNPDLVKVASRRNLAFQRPGHSDIRGGFACASAPDWRQL